MADEQTSTVAEDVSTSVPAEPVESTPTQVEPTTAADVWDAIDDVEEEEAEPVVAEKETSDEVEKEATPPEPKEEKQEEKEEEEREKTAEEEALEEAFADESEKKPDETEEELAKMSEEEIRERQRNKYARDYLDRVSKRAETLKRFQFDDTPIAEVADEFKEISEERFIELSQHAAHQLVDANPQSTFERAYAVKMLQKNPNWDIANAKYPSLDDLIAGVAPAQETTQAPRPSAPAELQDVTRELDTTLGWDWRNPELDENFVDERELAMAKTIRALEAKAAEEATQNQELNKKLEGLSQGQKTAEQERIEVEIRKEIKEFRGELEKTILPYVAKTNGLEISPDDTPEIRAFKENRMLLFTGTEYDKANDYPSQFESFAYNESTVRNELETITKRVFEAQVRKVQARAEKNTADIDKYNRAIADEKLPLSQLLGQANKEFKAKFIAPDLALIGMLSSKLAEPRKEASERIEVTSNGGAAGSVRPQKKDYDTADDVWSGMVEDAAKEEKLRADA